MSIVIIFFQVKILLFKQLWLYNRLIGVVAESKEMIATPKKKDPPKTIMKGRKTLSLEKIR